MSKKTKATEQEKITNLILHFCISFVRCLDVFVARRPNDVPTFFIGEHSFRNDAKHLLRRQPKQLGREQLAL